MVTSWGWAFPSAANPSTSRIDIVGLAGVSPYRICKCRHMRKYYINIFFAVRMTSEVLHVLAFIIMACHNYLLQCQLSVIIVLD